MYPSAHAVPPHTESLLVPLLFSLHSHGIVLIESALPSTNAPLHPIPLPQSNSPTVPRVNNDHNDEPYLTGDTLGCIPRTDDDEVRVALGLREDVAVRLVVRDADELLVALMVAFADLLPLLLRLVVALALVVRLADDDPEDVALPVADAVGLALVRVELYTPSI